MALAACTTAAPVGEWLSFGNNAKHANILVIGVTTRSTRRRVWEDRFVEALAAEGSRGIPGYGLLESSLQLTRSIVERAIVDRGIDGVVVTRLVGIKEDHIFRLPPNSDETRGYLGFYDQAWREASDGHYAVYRIFTLETTFYEAHSGKLLWSMQSQSMNASQPRELIEDQIRLAVKTLKSHGLI